MFPITLLVWVIRLKNQVVIFVAKIPRHVRIITVRCLAERVITHVVIRRLQARVRVVLVFLKVVVETHKEKFIN